MRGLVFGTILVAAACAGVGYIAYASSGGADYALSVKEARHLLSSADRRKGKLPFGTLDVLVTAPSSNVVRYQASGPFASLDCSATFTPVEGEGVDVATACGRAALDGAGAPAASDITNIAFAEYVASALGERPFDEDMVRAKSAGAVLSNLPKMQRDALRMSREVSEMQQEVDQAETSSADAGDDWGADTSF